MEQKSLISVIVPVYNVEQWLERCIESICRQSYHNLQIILVDDGSTDNSGKICDRFALTDSRVLVIHKKNGGLSDARNAGMLQAKGEYISFVDSDDWLESLFYENLFFVIQKYDCDIVGCEYQKKKEQILETTDISNISEQVFDRTSAMSALIDNRIQQVVWNKLYKQKIIEDIFFKKGKYHEDEFWSYQVFARAKTYVSIDYIGYNYFQRENSIMGEEYSLKRLDAVEAKVERQNFLNSHFSELVVKGKINLIFTCLYHGQLSLTYLPKNEQKKALKYLKSIIEQFRVNGKETKDLSFSHKIWLFLAKNQFLFACILRNLFKVGL
ncbi:glycosyltransferase family 2 protein [Anaerostipes faecalis]|uniref:glycosyltransferase family 2 protein n=1 Tax=Anaerostipes faecalis TaxID=2738446 RepID=UPI001C1E6C0E|nr:glycosyltransferase [Anaerostipes faecalis]